MPIALILEPDTPHGRGAEPGPPEDEDGREGTQGGRCPTPLVAEASVPGEPRAPLGRGCAGMAG